MDPWNPGQYERFKAERERPFTDLLSLIRRRPGMKVLDAGCGTGELTARLHRELSAAETLGVDSSEAMLARAAPAPGLRFEREDLRRLPRSPDYDLVFSHAVLHWVPDHPSVLAHLTGMLSRGGQLAIQMPANFDHASHLTAVEVASEPPFRDALEPGPAPGVLPPEAYAVLLHRLGFTAQVVRLQVYGHLLADREQVVEWVKGTLLTDYRRRLPEHLYPQFLARYRERLLPKLEDARPYFFPFKRILLWAELP